MLLFVSGLIGSCGIKEVKDWEGRTCISLSGRDLAST
jgi:hypothetical protein